MRDAHPSAPPLAGAAEGAGQEPTTGRLLRDPGHLLHKLYPENDVAAFLRVTEERLRGTAFLDGRTPLSDQEPIAATGLAAAAGGLSGGGGLRRYIFHGAFCGSTLLARLLDHPGHTLVLREPYVLAELADRKLNAPPEIAGIDTWCAVATTSLFHPRRPGERVVVKPSNWVNNLLPELCGAGDGVRAVFIEASLPDFLAAVFRGGGERLKFAGRAAERLSRGDAVGEALLARAQRDGSDPMRQAANMAVVLHHLQRRRTDAARVRAGWTGAQVIAREVMLSDPLEAARRADRVLELGLPDAVLRDAVETWSTRYSKDADVRYGPDIHAAVDREVQGRFGDQIRAACEWAEARGVELG